MAIFDFLRGEFIDVIHWTDETRDTIVWRFERQGHAIKYGAKLTVREGQAAVFVHEGQLADTFGPGLYQLETNNMPILTTLQHWDHGFQSPFKSEIYFVNTRNFTDLKWGTRNPIMCRDPEFGVVRLRAFGSYTMRVTDPAKFLIEIVGTDGEFTTEEIEFQIRNIIITHFSQIIASSGIPVLDMAGNTLELAKLVHERIAPMVADYGLELPAFFIENISLPAEVEAVMDKRTSTAVAGDLQKYTDFAAAEALGKAAENPGGGGGIGAGIGMGMGMGMADRLSRSGPWGSAPAAAAQGGAPAGAAPTGAAPAGGATPPPPPSETKWHVAVDGKATGPYAKSDLARMAAEGSLTRDSWLWTPAGPDWVRGRDVTELADVFGAVPPPPPPA
jgi:membrane protease subunit (stomatin/prohibitin family)